MENKTMKTMMGAVALSGVALAGPVAEPMPPAAAGDICDTLKSLGGSIYESGFINSVKMTGRAHFNAAYTEGDVNSADFDDTAFELWRLRVGTEVKFLNDFTLVASANLNKDSAVGDVSFGYSEMYELYLQYSLGSLLGIEDAAITYGRMRNDFTAEGTTSSNELKTVDRSWISNHYFRDITATGVKLSGKAGAFNGALGAFSTEADSDTLSDWNHSVALYGSLAYDSPCGGTLTLQLLDNDVSAGDDDRFGYDWASSLSYSNKFGNWDLLVDWIYGEETNGDGTSGVVIMPSKFIVPDTVEFVARYEYADSDGANIGLSRYAGDVSGAGAAFDERHALYVGLNYYLCGDHAKVQIGAEYETADGPAGASADATTLWLGFRTSF